MILLLKGYFTQILMSLSGLIAESLAVLVQLLQARALRLCFECTGELQRRAVPESRGREREPDREDLGSLAGHVFRTRRGVERLGEEDAESQGKGHGRGAAPPRSQSYRPVASHGLPWSP